MGIHTLDDDEGDKLLAKAKDLIAKGDYIKGLEIVEDLMLVHNEDKGLCLLRAVEGDIFLQLEEKTEKFDLRFVYMLASVACFSEDASLLQPYACGLYDLGEKIGSALYYKKCVKIAKQCLSLGTPLLELRFGGLINETLIKDAEDMIDVTKKSTIKFKDFYSMLEPEVLESKKTLDLGEDKIKRLRSFWMGLDVNIKRNLMKVSIAELKSIVKEVYKRRGQDTLEEVLTSAKEDRKWRFWMCRTVCLKKFFSAEECKNHLEQKHGADFKPSLEKHRAERIGKDWVRKILFEQWEPVDTVVAVELIKNQFAYVKEFMSKSRKNGWSKEWPIAADEERSKLLKDIRLLLVSLSNLNILSRSIRDWLMCLPQLHLAKLAVSEQNLFDSRLIETPQSICFLERNELYQIQALLAKIKLERNDGTDQICRVVDIFWSSTRVKEKIDFDPQFSFLLLDKRLWKSNNAPFDDEGTINVFDPIIHYAKAHTQGDDIISWLVDYSLVDESFPRPIRQHNLDIWVAVLRAVQFTCRALRTKYAKKMQIFDYKEAITAVYNLCIKEDKRRENLQDDQWNSYASLLRNKCEERIHEHSISAKRFLSAVRDSFKGRRRPTFNDLDDCMSVIREPKILCDDIVFKAIKHLKSVVFEKVLLIDSKILLIDNSRIRLLNSLTKLSIFDNRSYMLQMLKPFLLGQMIDMEQKVKSDAAVADLLFQEEKKSQGRKKKKKNKKKMVSTNMPQDLDEIVEREPEGTSPSLKTMEEDLIEPESTPSSKTDNQEEATKDMQNMLGEDSLSEHLEPTPGVAVDRYNSALDMTLKALLNIHVLKEDLKHNEQPCHHNLEEQVPSALQNLFTAFRSEEIEKRVYSFLFSDLLAYFEEANPLSSDAAEVLVTILKFWHCWKNSERESLVTRLFTLLERENLSCRECRRKTNHQEQSSYGIVMAADSIRNLKCAFGNIKFVDILKMIRMEDAMLCDIKTGGCGTSNFVHRTMTKRPPIFTIVLQWEKNETEKEISETTNTLDLEINISRLYEGLEQNTNYQLVSMVGYGEEYEEHICIAYEKKRWINLKRESLEKEDVGDWKSVVRLFEEMKVRPEILFYEAACDR